MADKKDKKKEEKPTLEQEIENKVWDLQNFYKAKEKAFDQVHDSIKYNPNSIKEPEAREKYINQLYETLREAVGQFYSKMEGKPRDRVDLFMEEMGALTYDQIKEIVEAEGYRPANLSAALAKSHQDFAAGQFDSIAKKHVLRYEHVPTALKAMNLEEEIAAELVNVEIVQKYIVQFGLQGRVPDEMIPAKFRKKKSKKS